MATTYFHGIESNRNVHQNFVVDKKATSDRASSCCQHGSMCLHVFNSILAKQCECFQNTALKYGNRKMGYASLGAFRNSGQFRSVKVSECHIFLKSYIFGKREIRT